MNCLTYNSSSAFYILITSFKNNFQNSLQLYWPHTFYFNPNTLNREKGLLRKNHGKKAMMTNTIVYGHMEINKVFNVFPSPKNQATAKGDKVFS